MSTRSRIGIIRGENRVESIYCHFDGYPSGVGAMLAEHWTDPAKVEALIALGDLSCLGEEIGEAHDFDTHLGTYNTDTGKREGSSVPADESWTLAYGRDRGESDVGSRVHPVDEWPDYGQEAEYLFDGRAWRCRSEMLNPVGWNTVAQADGWLPIASAIALDAPEAVSA